MTPDELDPTGLIAESYRIEGITIAECRGLFLDWLLSHRDRQMGAAEIGALAELYAADHPDHPMTAVLREGMAGAATPAGRRGGIRGRRV